MLRQTHTHTHTYTHQHTHTHTHTDQHTLRTWTSLLIHTTAAQDRDRQQKEWIDKGRSNRETGNMRQRERERDREEELIDRGKSKGETDNMRQTARMARGVKEKQTT